MSQNLKVGLRERWLDLVEAFELRPDPSMWNFVLPVLAFGGTFTAPATIRPLIWAATLLIFLALAGLVLLFVAAWVLDGAVAYAVSRSARSKSSQARAGSATLQAWKGHPAGR